MAGDRSIPRRSSSAPASRSSPPPPAGPSPQIAQKPPHRTQPERTRALEGFKAGTVRVLVATDVAARGLDIEDLPHVVNFELPWQPHDYVHRIGRTGRAGASGDAVSLVSIDEADLLRGVQRLLKKAIPWTVEPGFEPDRNAEVQPLRGGPPSAGRPETHHRPNRRPVRSRTSAVRSR